MMHHWKINLIVVCGLLMAPKEHVFGLPINKSEDQTLSEISSELPSSSAPDKITPHPNKGKKSRRSSTLENSLGCQNFICLLAKFDLLKTDHGYIVTPYEDPAPPSVKKLNKDCKSFRCWLGQFRWSEKSYGWEVTFKSSAKEDTVVQESPKSQNKLEPDWPFDILGDLMGSTTTTPSPIQTESHIEPSLDFDTIFSKT